MPHYPYAFRADCSIEPDVGLWLEAQDRDLLPLRNTPESRALRYPLYLDQVACVQAKVMAMLDILDAKGLLAEAVILIHGDHGSRINLHEPIPEYEDRFTPEDFSDVFSTFFAVKAPVVAPGVDRRPLPLDHLFRRVLLEEREPGDRDLVADPRVFLQIRYEDIREVPFRPPARFLAAGDSGP
jgi:hypothetical protein